MTTTPEYCRFEVNLRGNRLPVSFTIPDLPDSPPSDEHIDLKTSLITADERTDSKVTSDTDSSSTTTVDLGVGVTSLLSVSTILMSDVHPDRWHCVGSWHHSPNRCHPQNTIKVPVVSFPRQTFPHRRSLRYQRRGQAPNARRVQAFRHFPPHIWYRSIPQQTYAAMGLGAAEENWFVDVELLWLEVG
jgi:hypothetical protein